uniref:Uncharacterized protein TCIL3000_9_3870 n=1 Tax=Trypanosoma congolense (strain IL3000) TaxID=1068625 RepID=G0UUC3_TRYCI|nr:unnamed protein product [Trypanosoma congolense IL3000]
MTEYADVLTDAERYTIWCEKVRTLFSQTPINTNVEEENEDEHFFPYCFYVRMLGSVGKGAEAAGAWSQQSGESEDSQFSSISQRYAHADEDAVASRLTTKLQAHARSLVKQQEKQRHVENLIHSAKLKLPFRDCAVEAKVAAINEDLHDMLLYVRRQNMLASELRRRLRQTQQLLAMRAPSSP